MSSFFIKRPIFAWVVAIFIIMAGLVTLVNLPINQYPKVAPPTITISTIYPGASAQTHQDAVLTLIEQQMNGLEGLDYLSTEANSDGSGQVVLTFKNGINEDIAQVNVQNALAAAEPRLPQVVRDMGIDVRKSMSNFLMVVSIGSKTGKTPLHEISEYASNNIRPELQRINGVGNAMMFGSNQAMRIWLDPEKMQSYGLNSMQVAAAIKSQNIQIPAGTVGSLPSNQGQAFTASILMPAQLASVEEFDKVVIKYNPDGSTVTLKDIATTEVGQESYNMRLKQNGKDAVGIAVQLSSDGNAVAVAKLVREKIEELKAYFPEDLTATVPFDTSIFVNVSIVKVLTTLAEAIGLVFVVMFLFLQNIRYTIIPTIVVPISLLGAVAVMGVLGLSINVLTMFAMVLVIGIVVDDAILVVENIERLISEERLSPKEAALKGMRQISGAVIGITVVLVSVFIPLAFFPGASGNIYRQFSLVMVASIGFSAFLALSLTPSLCATLLKPAKKSHNEKTGFFGAFNRGLRRTNRAYQSLLGKFMRGAVVMLVIYGALTAGATWIYLHLPNSFLPNEDQGVVLATVQLPSGATQERTAKVVDQIIAAAKSVPEIKDVTAVLGFSFSGRGQNMAMAFITLTDWSERKNPDQSAQAIADKMNKMLFPVRDGFIFVLSPPAIPELGSSDGFNLILEDRGGNGHEALVNARNQLMGMASQDKRLTQVRPNGLEDAPQLLLTINRDAAYAKGVDLASVAATLASQMGGSYLNDYPNNGNLQRVMMQAKPDSRMQGEDILNLRVPNNMGQLISLSEFVTAEWAVGAEQLRRYNNYPSMTLTGQAAPGGSSGDAMAIMEDLVSKLPTGFGMEWTGQSLEEQRAGNMSAILYGFAILSVFLCLAALYESWSIPFSVILVVPLGFLGVVAGVFMRGMANDVYFQVGMITVIGLSAKNAILIVEFAKDLQAEGIELVRAVLRAAQLRFRPILMTSMAFISGVLPLYFSTGVSSASQRAIGTSVFWGMLVGAILAMLFVPIFYFSVRKIFPAKIVATGESKHG